MLPERRRTRLCSPAFASSARLWGFAPKSTKSRPVPVTGGDCRSATQVLQTHNWRATGSLLTYRWRPWPKSGFSGSHSLHRWHSACLASLGACWPGISTSSKAHGSQQRRSVHGFREGGRRRLRLPTPPQLLERLLQRSPHRKPTRPSRAARVFGTARLSRTCIARRPSLRSFEIGRAHV